MKRHFSVISLLCCIFLAGFAKAQNVGSNFATGSQEKKPIHAQSWQSNLEQPEAMRFRAWTSRYLAPGTSGPKAKQKLLAEGVELAKQRRAAFAKLIKSDPAQALASTVPAAIRKR